MKKIHLDKSIYRCKDMNPDKVIPYEEDVTYYKFFNEWSGRKVFYVNNVRHVISVKNSYEGYIILTPKSLGEVNELKISNR